MWYKTAQNGFGGGMLNAVELKIQQALSPVVAEEPVENAEVPQNPIDEPTDVYEKRLWDAIVNKTDGITKDNTPHADTMGVVSDGLGSQSNEARRLSPYHKNPEETTMEEQLEAVRQENVNNDPQSMSSTDGVRGSLLVRGEFPYASGKGWTGYEDLPSDKSWA